MSPNKRLRPTRDAAPEVASHVARLVESSRFYGVDTTLKLLQIGREGTAAHDARRAIAAAGAALDRLRETRAAATATGGGHHGPKSVAADLGIPLDELESPGAGARPGHARGGTADRSIAWDFGLPDHELLSVERLREGTFETPNGDTYFQDSDTLRDAMDLLAVTKELHSTGSPNLENDEARLLADSLQAHGLLSNSELETLRRLTSKYRAEIDALRQSGDHEGQDFLDVPEGATARLPLEEQ